jgi:membrane-bound metal-dependent hydrolase YbcI (DUF457 family)
VAANLPDIDVFFHYLQLSHIEFFNHRTGFFHSVFFAALGGYSIGNLSFRAQSPQFRNRISVFFAIIMLSHGFLDALTKGAGVAFLYPVITEQYFVPITPLLPAGFNFSEFVKNGAILREAVVIWIPSALLCIFIILRLRRKKS